MPITVFVGTTKPLSRPQANVQALMAGLACVSRGDSHYFNARLNTLVLKELSKLIECPRVGTPTLCFIARLLIGSISDASQVFNSYQATRPQGIPNDCSTDCVVQPRLISSLTSRQPFQDISNSSPSRSCAFRDFCLERSSDFGKLISGFGYSSSIPFIAVTGYGNVAPPKINTNDVFGLNGIWGIILNLNVDVVLAITVFAQLSRRWCSAFKFSSLVVSYIDLDVFSTAQKRQANCPVFFPERENPSVIVSTGWLEFLNRLAFEFCCLSISSNSCTHPNGLVSTQSKLLSQGLIHQVLDSCLAGYRSFDVLIRIVAAVSKSFEQFFYFENLLKAWLKLTNYSQNLFQVSKISQVNNIYITAKIMKIQADCRRLKPLPCFPLSTKVTELPASEVSP